MPADEKMRCLAEKIGCADEALQDGEAEKRDYRLKMSMKFSRNIIDWFEDNPISPTKPKHMLRLFLCKKRHVL
jgi:hypothetical protein